MRRQALWLVSISAVGAACLGLISYAGEQKNYMGPGTRRMAAMLAKLADEADANPQLNPFWNEKRADALRLLLAQQLDKEKEAEVRLTLGEELLRSGQTQEAIELFLRLQEQLSRSEVKGSLQMRAQVPSLLGLAYLRLGEQDNCIRSHNVESCLFPIRPGGVHTLQKGSRLAIDQFRSILGRDTGNLTAQWLLNIAYMTVGEYPSKVPEDLLIPPESFASEYAIKRFVDVAPQLGIARPGLAGGAIMDDFDGDGYLDLMVSSSGLRDQIRYYHNNADGTFTDKTAEAGLTGIVGGLNLIQADYNNDGHLDVLVLRGAWMKGGGQHPKSLLRNNGNGTFDDVTEEAGLGGFHPTQTAAWGDYDGDGWLDLYVGYESEADDRHPCELFHNNRDGTFTQVAAASGVANVGYVKAVVWGDYNNDGRPDLYLSRLGASNVLYRNDGATDRGWKFTDVSLQARVQEPRDSFPAWFWDYDNDGWLDIFVSGWRAPNSVADVAADYMNLPHEGETPRLYHNNHDGTFSNVTAAAKLNRLLVAMGSNYGDVDNDGWPDFYLGTGAPDLAMLVPNRMFRNADGKFFQDVTTSSGTGHLQKGHGVAFGDIDNDGDQDIYETMGGAYTGDTYWNVLFLNPGNTNHWITLKLEGVRSNRSAIGTRIRVTVETPQGNRDIFATVSSGGSFGGSSLQQEIGLGNAKAIRQIEITWPASGSKQVFRNVAMDQILKIREDSKTPVPVRLKKLDLASGSKSEPAHQQHDAMPEGYAGAQTCAGCHPKQFAKQSRSHHAEALHRGSEISQFAYLPEGRIAQGASYDFAKSSSDYRVIVGAGNERAEFTIDWIIGANDQGLTFFSQLAPGRYLEHRLSYYRRKSSYDVTAGHGRAPPDKLDAAVGVPVSAREATKCLGCHSTFVKDTATGPEFASVIPGVTCERCHGLGATHVSAMKVGRGERHIRNPGKLSGEELLAMCGECHRTEPPAGVSFDEPIVTRFQPVGLQMSACFQKSNGAITCTTCHDPHENARRSDDGYYEAKCRNCHAGPSAKICPVDTREGCIRCHMPKVQPIPWVAFADHWIRPPASRTH